MPLYTPLHRMADWLVGLQHKDSLASRVMVQLLGNVPYAPTPRDYEHLAKEGFSECVPVYRGVMHIASGCAGIKWGYYRLGRGSGTQDIREEDAPILRLIKKPNPDGGWGDLIEQHVAYEVLNGNAYLEAIRSQTDNGRPIELNSLRPDRVRVVPGDGKRKVAGYKYIAGSFEQNYSREEIDHWKMFAPLRDWYGLSPVEVAAKAIDQHNAGNIWNAALLQNSARPPGAFSVKGQLADPDFERFEKQIAERYQGPANAAKPFILEDVIGWTQFSLSPAEMDWLQGLKYNGVQIAIALGVPSELVDPEHKTYSNYQEARKALYEEAVLPVMDKLAARLNSFLVPMYGDEDRYELRYEKDDIEALQEDRQVLRTYVMDAWKTGLYSLNDALAELGKQKLDIPEADIHFVPNTVKPIEQAAQEPPKPPDPLELLKAKAEIAKQTSGAGANPDQPQPPNGPQQGQPGPDRTPSQNGGDPSGKAPPGQGKEAAPPDPVDPDLALLTAVETLARQDPEWARAYLFRTGTPIGTDAVKHLPGQHDQLRHGRSGYPAGVIAENGHMGYFSLEARDKMKQHMADAGYSFDDMVNIGDGVMQRAKGSPHFEDDRTWYNRAHDAAGALAARHGVPVDTAEAVVAAMSPRNRWDQTDTSGKVIRTPNLDDADFILKCHAQNPNLQISHELVVGNARFVDLSRHEGKTVKFNDLTPEEAAYVIRPYLTGLPPNTAKAVKIARGADIDQTLGGSKVRSFYDNIHAPDYAGPVTIDTWMVQALTYRKKGLWTENEVGRLLQSPQAKDLKGVGSYPWFGDVIGTIAAKHGLKPHEAQAIMWSQFRREMEASGRGKVSGN